MTPTIIRKLSDLRALTKSWHANADVIGVVPTMGALHAGHLSLVDAAKANCDRVIVTIFVNPKQFDNPDDLKNYPRTEHDDAAKLRPFNVDVIYVPDPDQIYPDGFATNVTISGLPDMLCGAHRPGHFDGVATVVSKLFLQTSADRAFFGEKDFQQLQIVTRLARDLDIPVEITGCATVREEDGLALSSRNQHLNSDARGKAPALNRAMRTAAAAIQSGANIMDALKTAEATILKAGFDSIDYLELRAEDGLTPLETLSEPARLLAAAFLDGVRLIDNIEVKAD
ncbi:MAG: pantoate--beta-alanine ligase [Halocynthiibacter sp.]